MTRRDYVRNIWLPDHLEFLLLTGTVIGACTAPDVPGLVAQAFSYFGAACLWMWILILLRWLTWTPWKEEPSQGSPFADNVVPLRPGPGDAG